MILNCYLFNRVIHSKTYVERFNRTVRYDWLAQFLFESIEEIQQQATNWLWSYNNENPIWHLMTLRWIVQAMRVIHRVNILG